MNEISRERAQAAAAKIALPGDPDLDCHLTGLRIQAVISAPDDFGTEVILTFATEAASGWWVDSATGRRVQLTRIRELEAVYGIKMRPGWGILALAMTTRLEAWRDDRAPVEMTSAPGRWALLNSPGHPVGSQVVLPLAGFRFETAVAGQ